MAELFFPLHRKNIRENRSASAFFFSVTVRIIGKQEIAQFISLCRLLWRRSLRF